MLSPQKRLCLLIAANMLPPVPELEESPLLLSDVSPPFAHKEYRQSPEPIGLRLLRWRFYICSTGTASKPAGPRRTLGQLCGSLGNQVENLLPRAIHGAGLGPDATLAMIRGQAHHPASNTPSQKEKAWLAAQCRKMLSYAE